MSSFGATKGIEASQAFFNEISNIFIDANPEKYSYHLSKNVDIMLDNDAAIYSKTQAQIVLKNYLQKINPQEFKIKYRSYTDKNDFLYLISTLTASEGLYNIYITMRWESNSYKIIEIKFRPL